ncbi:hypothetical protein [Spirosoma telluris]
MKLHKYIYIPAVALLLTLGGCEKPFDQLEQDPTAQPLHPLRWYSMG